MEIEGRVYTLPDSSIATWAKDNAGQSMKLSLKHSLWKEPLATVWVMTNSPLVFVRRYPGCDVTDCYTLNCDASEDSTLDAVQCAEGLARDAYGKGDSGA